MSLPLNGNMKLNMRMEETGKISDWVLIDGNGSINNLEFKSKSPEIILTNTRFLFNWSQNELRTELKESYLIKILIPTSMEYLLLLKFLKKLPVSAVASNIKLNVILESLILKSFPINL